MTQKTLVMFKPGYGMTEEQYREMVELAMSELRELGLSTIGTRFIDFYDEIDRAKGLYGALRDEGKSYYRNPVRALFISPPIACQIWQGDNAVVKIRTWLGPTKLADAEGTNTFRGRMLARYGRSGPGELEGAFNFAHASDGPESARREIKIIFGLELETQ